MPSIKDCSKDLEAQVQLKVKFQLGNKFTEGIKDQLDSCDIHLFTNSQNSHCQAAQGNFKVVFDLKCIGLRVTFYESLCLIFKRFMYRIISKISKGRSLVISYGSHPEKASTQETLILLTLADMISICVMFVFRVGVGLRNHA